MTITADVRGRITFTDPEDGTIVELFVYRDPESGYAFAMDKDYLEVVGHKIMSPFSPEDQLKITEPEEQELELGHRKYAKLSASDDDDDDCLTSDYYEMPDYEDEEEDEDDE